MIFFRVDSNNTIASGHIMRCITIAKEIVKRGHEVKFLISDCESIPFLEKEAFSYIVLNTLWQDLSCEIPFVIEILKKCVNPILFIDTYSITKEYVDSLARYSKIVYLGSKDCFLGDIDLLINYSADINYSLYDNYNKTKLLLGPKYAPLREEFYNNQRCLKKNEKHILLTVGNSDKIHFVYNFLSRFLSVFNDMNNVYIDVIIGKFFDDKKYIYDEFYKNNHVNFYENVSNMSELMSKSYLAISANGTTVYELAAMSVPTISFAIVEEQRNSGNALYKLGVVDYCGDAYKDIDSTINLVIDKCKFYIKNYNLCKKLGEKANELIKGDGCKLIVDSVIKL